MTLQVFILNNLIRLVSNCFVIVNVKSTFDHMDQTIYKYIDNFNQIENTVLN